MHLRLPNTPPNLHARFHCRQLLLNLGHLPISHLFALLSFLVGQNAYIKASFRQLRQQLQYDGVPYVKHAYFNGDLHFTSLSKAYVGLGLYNEVVITLLNISINEKRQLANFQIRLWENGSETKTSRFSKTTDTARKLYFSDDYYDEGAIQIS